MSIQFNHLPGNIRVPGVYDDFNPSGANSAQQTVRGLIIGQVLAGTPYAAAVNQPVISLGAADAVANGGAGSWLALMVAMWKARYEFGELWVLPLLDDPAAVAATGSFAISGTATAYGTLPLYIDFQLVSVLVAPGMTGAQVATAAAAAAAGLPNLPVTAVASSANLNLTAKNKGAAANDIDLRVAYRGALGGESVPAGLTVTTTAMTGGTTNPSLPVPLLNLADLRFEVIICPFTDSASLDAMKALMDENTGRWSWQRKLYGHVYAGKAATVSQASTFGPTRNDQHVSVLPMGGCPLSPPEFISDIGAGILESVAIDPAVPLQYITTNIPPPLPKDRYGISDRNALLFDGLSTTKVVAGVVETERMVTTYQLNAVGSPDTSYLNCETMHSLGYVCRDLDSFLSSRFARMKLIADNIPIPGGSSLVNPAVIKATLDTRYRYLCEVPGVCQDPAGFAKESRVELAGPGTGRVNIYAPIRLAGQLRIMAISVAFSTPT